MECTNASMGCHSHTLAIHTHAKGHHSALPISLAETGFTHSQWKVGTKAPIQTHTQQFRGWLILNSHQGMIQQEERNAIAQPQPKFGTREARIKSEKQTVTHELGTAHNKKMGTLLGKMNSTNASVTLRNPSLYYYLLNSDTPRDN